jgi:glyoxylase-like metal-dependent hydrolase (beta-lactamase superfamily II)
MAKASKQTYAVPLYEGTYSIGIDKRFNRIGRDDAPAKGALKVSINPFLIRGKNRNYLFDAGIGEFTEDTSTDTIKENLARHDISEYEITDIFISHLHYDHIGGLAGQPSGHWELTFPEAKVWVSRKDWKKSTSQDEYYDKEKTDFLHFLNAKADLHYLTEEDHPYPEIQVKEIGGHSEFSQLLLYDDGDQKYLMAGDVLATRGEVNRKFAAKYDYDGQTSMKEREKITQKAFEENYIIMAYHDSHHPLFKLTDYNENKGYTIENIDNEE